MSRKQITLTKSDKFYINLNASKLEVAEIAEAIEKPVELITEYMSGTNTTYKRDCVESIFEKKPKYAMALNQGLALEGEIQVGRSNKTREGVEKIHAHRET